jgi:hypothetical protein
MDKENMIYIHKKYTIQKGEEILLFIKHGWNGGTLSK